MRGFDGLAGRQVQAPGSLHDHPAQVLYQNVLLGSYRALVDLDCTWFTTIVLLSTNERW